MTANDSLIRRSKYADLPLHSGTIPRERTRRHHWIAFIALCLLVLLVQNSLWGGYHWLSSDVYQHQTRPRNPAYLIEAENGAVASENKICSDIGIDIMKSGGNAVDAAVGTTFCIGVVVSTFF